MDSLKSFDIQLTDIWIECQKEMIEMRNKIMNLSDCLKTSELINRHLSKCNETLVVIIEKCRLDHKNNEIIVLINVIREEEKCFEKEKQNLKKFLNKSSQQFEDNRVFELIKVWNQCKPKRALTKDKAIQTINNCSLNQIQSLDQISDNRSVDCIEECNERPKRHRKVISYKALNEEIDITDKEVENKEEVNESNNSCDDKNGVNTNCVTNGYKSDEDFGSIAEEFENSDNSYSEEEKKSQNKKRNKNNTFREKKVLFLNVKQIREKLLNNECETEINDNIKRIYLKANDSKEERIRIGFGCPLIGCEYVSNRKLKTQLHISKHMANKNYKKVCTDLTVKEISETLASVEYVSEIDENNVLVKKFYRKTDGLERLTRRDLIGFGCSWIGCEYVSNKMDRVLSHIDSIHETLKTIKCEECEYRTSCFDSMKKHLINNHNKKCNYYDCNEEKCKFRTKYLAKYKAHILTKKHQLIRSSNSKEKLIKMIESNETTIENDEKNEWINIHRVKSDAKKLSYIAGYGCKWKDCQYLTMKRTKMVDHINGKHLNNKPYACDKCQFRSIRKLTLTQHQSQMHGVLMPGAKARTTFECDWNDCKFKCISKSALTLHKNRHLGIKPFKCDWPSCDYSAVSQCNVEIHINAVHKDLRPFPCEWPGCEWAFRTRNDVKHHMITHGEERPFKCVWPGCKAAFRSDSCVRQHRVVHTRKKRHACNWPGCESTFRDTWGLGKHMMIHKNEWPVGCRSEGCDQRFRDKKQMEIHYNSRHK